jgi:hypothetical protein
MPANDIIVLSACADPEHRDDLVVQQHRYFAVGGSYDWYWLFDRTGTTEKGAVGDYDNEQAVRDAINEAGLCTR